MKHKRFVLQFRIPASGKVCGRQSFDNVKYRMALNLLYQNWTHHPHLQIYLHVLHNRSGAYGACEIICCYVEPTAPFV